MNHFWRYIFVLLFSSMFVSARSQALNTARKWTLQECFQYAKKENIQINTLRLNQQSAAQDLIAAKAMKIPSLSASVSNTFQNANNNVYDNAHLVAQLTSNLNYALNSSIVLWNNNYINNNIKQQYLQTRSAGFTVQQAENNSVLSITQAYLAILLAKENEKYIADLVNTTDSSVKHGQLLFDAGSIAKKDLLQLQAQLASDKYLLVQAQNEIRLSTLSLKQILQLPADTPFDIVTPASVTMEEEMPAPETVQDNALQNFPEVKVGQLGIDIAALGVEKSKANFKPVLKAGATIGSGYSDILVNGTGQKTAYFTQTGNNFYQTLGLTLAIPIFSNKINKTNLEKSEIAFRQANLIYKNDKLILSQAVEQAYLNAVNAKQAYVAADQQLKAASESYRIANEQFRLGGVNIYDLLQQRNQYVQAIQSFTQNKYSSVLQQKLYEFYMGRDVTL